jgi:hypothetical protein
MTSGTDPDFDAEVAHSFQPLADRAKLPLTKIKDGVYEMAGHSFVLRIRRGTGHARDFVVTLASRSSLSEDPEKLAGEIGLLNFAEVYGEQLNPHPLQTSAGYRKAFQEAADVAGKLCVPYLLGLRGDADFAKVREHVDRKIAAAGGQWNDAKFIKNVRKEWL